MDGSMDGRHAKKGVAGPLARPAPPGRRRTASRIVSSASTAESPRLGSESPSLRGTGAIIESDGDGNSNYPHAYAHAPEGLGLSLGSDRVDAASSAASEIPLREVEQALAGLSREDLVLALKRAKEQMDILDSNLDSKIEHSEILESRISELVSQAQAADAEIEQLQSIIQQREERVDELMREQDREEDQVYANMAVIERLRKRLAETERGRAEAEKRYSDQTATADKERQLFIDMEALLHTQKAKASTAHERLLSSNQELSRENERLQLLVSQLRRTPRNFPSALGPDETASGKIGGASHNEQEADVAGQSQEDLSVDDPDTSLRKEGIRSLQDEAKALEVEALQAELSAMQKSHDMLIGQVQQHQTDLVALRTSNNELQEQNETYMSILQEKTFSGALLEESAMLNGRTYLPSSSENSEMDDADDVPDEPRRHPRSKGKQRIAASGSDDELQGSVSLASELESNSATKEEGRKRERRRTRSEALGDDVEELHKEIWSLRDSNQALTLYVSKILDRIISIEGYESVLAVDGDAGTLRSTPGRSKGQRVRHVAAGGTSGTPRGGRSTASGGGLLSFIGTSEEPKTPTAISPSFAARARRTASIDWRAMLGATTPQAVDGKQASNQSTTSSVPRKISSSEEVEDAHDMEEKEKIRRAMMSHGIQLPENQLKSQKRASAFGTFFTRVMGSGVSATPVGGKLDEVDSVYGTSNRLGSELSSSPTSTSVVVTADHDSEAESRRSSSPSNRLEARQNALKIGDAGHLTQAPRRVSPISSRRGAMERSSTSSTGASTGDTSRGESVGGDESFQFDSPTLSVDKALPSERGEEEGEEDRSWGKAFKRMSFLGAKRAD